METIKTAKLELTTIVMPQLISLEDVVKCTGLSRASIYRMSNEKSKFYDPDFPKKVQISTSRVVWISSEIAEWINQKIASRSA